MDLLPIIERYLLHHRLTQPNATLVVGVSGGADSVTLLHLLHRLAKAYHWRLHVAHLHHGLRGADADADAEFVAALAKRWGLPCTVEHVALPDSSTREQLSLEEAARRARYAFLARVAGQVGATTLAVGHNADDQAETVLMHLLRGTGLAGLRGMLPCTPLDTYWLTPQPTESTSPLYLIRPLLNTPRASIEAYCAAQDLETRFDRSNLDTTFFRNRLRYETLPYLRELNPRIDHRLQHLAEVVQADYDLLEVTLTAAWDTLAIQEGPEAIVFDLDKWRLQPLAVQRGLLRRAAYRLRPAVRDVDFVHIAQAVHIGAAGTTGAQATLPGGLRFTVDYRVLRLTTEDSAALPTEQPWLPPQTRLPIQLPGVTALPGAWRLRAELPQTWDLNTIRANADPWQAWLALPEQTGTLTLRTRRIGDRFQPHGLGGTEVRLSDFFISAKVPLAWRDHLPLLTCDDRILWIAGWRLNQTALVRPDTTRVVYLRFECGE